ncbi:MAG: WYL domain-containing protein, partial [Gemmatimonadaceae bacterium]
YHKSSGDAAERRTVCPFSFAVEQGAWYLIAHCDRSEGIRIFRLDRVAELRVLEDTFSEGSAPDVEALLADGRAFVGSPPERLRVRYSARVSRWLAERQQGAFAPDGSFEVEYPLGDEEWAVRHVLQYGPEAQILAPASVRELVRQRLVRIIAER